MKTSNKVFLFLVSFLTFSIFNLYGENFRVAKIKTIDIPANYSSVTTNIGINEALCINIPEDKTFLLGFEIEIKIPKIVATYRDSVIYSFFSDVSPTPKENIIDYSGKKLMINTIPPRLSVNLQTFFENIENKKESPYSTLLPFNLMENQNNLVLRFQMAMKGVPESFFTSEFTVTIKPILKDEGLLSFNFIYPQNTESKEEENENTEILESTKPIVENISKNEKIFVYIDDNLISDFSKPILLKSGTHHISVISESYRNEVRTVIINQATSTTLDIELKSISPEISIIAPENTKVFLDDLELFNLDLPIQVVPGEHQIKFIIGDYELLKKLTIQNGKSYEISLSIDIDISESFN